MKAVIDSTAIVPRGMKFGSGVVIGPNVCIEEDVWIGDYSCIGGHPEHRKFFDDRTHENTKGVIIRKGAHISEMVTVHAGTELPTVIGPGSAIFAKSHVAHDCFVGALVTIGGLVTIAGHCQLHEGSTISGKSALHQRCVVGAYGFLGAMSYLKSHIPPGEMWFGNPAKPAGMNQVGLERAGVSAEDLELHFRKWFDESIKGVTV